MPIEIEKKYRLTQDQKKIIISRLRDLEARRLKKEFEENILYTGLNLDIRSTVVRLRKVGKRTILTYKKRFISSSAIKRQLEEETEVSNGDAIQNILKHLGLIPSLVYEKRRETWRIGKAELVIDELPFGLFMEIEGPAAEIRKIEKALNLTGVRA
ncbi:MAG TPA: class IV adenylate cyclase, partial [Pyrinomonadaceae bacterium]|nr:class IV adenylate cyclase [Pyrinomonadaceae bacterium]